MSAIAKLGRRLRLGVLGGGPGSFIGPIHRAAARLDENYEVVAGVFSSNAARSKEFGVSIGLPPERSYGAAAEMFAGEAARADGIDAVAIMTPNDSHYALCCAAIERGLDVICDKPLTTTLADALDLVRRVRKSGTVFCLTFNYTGFPLVRQARAMVRDGDLGAVRMVKVEYVQGHNAALRDSETGKAAAWRFDAAKAGASLILGDIGSHAHHLASFVSGQNFAELTADVGAVVPGRTTDDYAGAVFRLEGGAKGVMFVTQAGAGARHGLMYSLFCEKGALEWHQETPNQLFHSRLGQPALTYERAGPGLKPQAMRAQRVAIGHPEGFLEAFATLYSDAAEAIVARKLGAKPDPLALDFPNVEDGARSMKFIDAMLASSRTRAWEDCRLKL